MSTILFVDHAMAIGGAEKSLLMLLDGLDRSRWMPEVACCRGEFSKAVKARGVPVHYLEMPSMRGLPRLAWFRTVHALSSGIDADLVYANTARSALYASIATLLGRRRFIWHMRDFTFLESGDMHIWMDQLMKQWVGRCATATIAISRSVANRMPNSDFVHVIHNGINPTAFDVKISQVESRQRFRLPEKSRIVGMLGRLRPWKGQERFLRIASKVLDKLPQTHFVIAGGDPFEVGDGYAEGVTLYAERLGIKHKVTFTGQLSEVADVLAALDLFVHPGDPEPFGLVNLEAMAMGKPIVAFAHGALPEIVEQNVTGILVAPGDEDACAAAIIKLLRAPERMRDLGAAGRARVEQFFHVTRTVTAVDELLQQQVGRRETKRKSN